MVQDHCLFVVTLCTVVCIRANRVWTVLYCTPKLTNQSPDAYYANRDYLHKLKREQFSATMNANKRLKRKLSFTFSIGLMNNDFAKHNLCTRRRCGGRRSTLHSVLEAERFLLCVRGAGPTLMANQICDKETSS